jgi:ribosomal subunit interface protein
MTLRVSGKNMDIGEALRESIENRIEEAVGKYFTGGFSGHVTVAPEGSGFRAEAMLHLDSGSVLRASSTDMDPHKCADQMLERIEKRLRRYKRKLKDHHNDNKANSLDNMMATTFIIESLEDHEEIPLDYAPAVIAENSTPIKTMTVAMAVMEMDLADQHFLMFYNASHGNLNVVYKRDDGNIGWLDPTLKTAAAE